MQQAEWGAVVLLLAVKFNSGNALQDAVVGQVNVPLLEGSRDEWTGRHPTRGTRDPRPECRLLWLPRCGLGQDRGGEWGGGWGSAEE